MSQRVHSGVKIQEGLSITGSHMLLEISVSIGSDTLGVTLSISLLDEEDM